MIRSGLTLGVALLVPVAAFSEPLRIRSGDHPEFTRLVVTPPGPRDWRIDLEGRTLHIAGQAGDTYDLSAVFLKIGTDRVSSVSQDPEAGRLAINLACDCEVATRPYTNNELIIDVRDEASNAFEDNTAPAPIFDGPVFLLSGHVAEPTPTIVPGTAVPVAGLTRPDLPVPSDPIPFTPPADTVAAVADAVAGSLERAAAQGLIDFRPEEHADDENRPIATANIRIETAVDRALGQAPDVLEIGNVVPRCLSPEAMDVASWSGPEPAWKQIGSLRRALVTDDKRSDDDAVLSLARLYVHLSFGAEARHTLRAFSRSDDDAGLVEVIAHLIDGQLIQSDALARQISCDTPAAFWAAVSLDALPRDEPIELDRILQTFSGLPPHLRRLLGPGLAEKFAASGDDASAVLITNGISRASDASDPATVFARATTGLEEERTDAALAEIATSASADAAEALATLLERHLARGTRVSADQVETAGIIAFERAGTPQGRHLKQMEIKARAARGEARLALATLNAVLDRPGYTPEDIELLAGVVLGAIAEHPKDAVFLELALDPRTRDLVLLVQADAREPVAERLLTIGFAAEARQILPPVEATDPLYPARLAFAEGDLGRTLQLSSDPSSEDATRLRAAALSRAGRHDEAARLLAGLDADASTLEAWRAGDWGRAASGKAPTLAAAARARLTAEAPTDIYATDDPTLAEADTVLKSSEGLRDTLSALLSDGTAPGE